MQRQTNLCLLLLTLVAGTAYGLNRRLAVGDFLEGLEETFHQDFDAVLGEQLYILAKPLTIFDRTVEQIKIFANGFIMLGNHSIEVPHQYPSGTVTSQERLTSLDGDFISVFSTVNQCSTKGRIFIRELKSNNLRSNTCVWKHLERLKNIISLSSDDDPDFDPGYILTITWSDMGCISSLDPKRNTFSVVLLANAENTYAIFQYINIEWTADHSTGSLPPEAGIFIHSFDDIQLPRSNLHTEPSVWNEESNMAVAGEWIFALRQAPVDIDASYQSEIRTLTDKFLESSYAICMGDANHVVTPMTDDIIQQDVLSTSANDESTNPKVELEEVLVTETSRPVEAETEAIMETETKFAHSSTAYSGDEEKRNPIYTPERSFRRCPNDVCMDPMADCFQFKGDEQCCVCPASFYGGGVEGCWAAKPERPRRLNFNGYLKLNIEEGNDLRAHMFTDTEVKSDDTILTRSGVRGLSKNAAKNASSSSQQIGLLAPVFHLLNSFLSLPPQNCELEGEVAGRIFNVFTLTNGFSAPFRFTLVLDISNHGKLKVTGELKRLLSEAGQYRGEVEVEVTRDVDFTPVTEVFTEGERNSVTKYVEYAKVGAGKVKFFPQILDMISPTGERLQVQWSGEGFTDESACLLAEDSLVTKEKKFYIRMSDQGYCHEDCRDENGCSFYCLDLPSFYSKKPEICDCVSCEKENEMCVSDGKDYACQCNSGFYRTSNGSCQENEVQLKSGGLCQLPLETGPCKANERKFGYNPQIQACQEFVYGGCQGNSNNFDSIEECEKKCAADNRDGSDVCRLPVVAGPCYASMRRFAFQNGRCEQFIYGGCKGNANNFETIEDCERTCRVAERPPVSSKEVCRLPILPGPCLADQERYGFDVRSGRCKKFIFGGCHGNENNFQTSEECEQTCGKGAVSASPSVPPKNGDRPREAHLSVMKIDNEVICSEKLTTGPCGSIQVRYGFYPPTRRCVRFSYGGCGGSRNNFVTLAECEDMCYVTCMNVNCAQNAFCERGVCVCLPDFAEDSYGSCVQIGKDMRTSNRAFSKPHICSKLLRTGPCEAKMTRYGFYAPTKQCLRFAYSGCRGNQNNFLTKKECEDQCLGNGLVHELDGLETHQFQKCNACTRHDY